MKVGITKKKFEQIFLCILSFIVVGLIESVSYLSFFIEVQANIGGIFLFVIVTFFTLILEIIFLDKIEVIEFKEGN